MASTVREHWSSRTGFLLAAIGSAVGLGNMWRFSYLAAENGGAAFVLLYLGITLLIGLPVLLAELLVGRGAQRSPVRALMHFGGPAWRPLGAVFVVTGFLILSYYSVIAGWTLRYAGSSLLTGFDASFGDRFGEIAEGADAIGFHVAFMALTVFVVAGGVKAGIERTATLLMPLLFVLVCGLALYAATLAGAGGGYRYYLTTDFREIASFEVLREAAGQAFFSLSVGMGAILTFGSYLGREHHLPNESLVIAFADMGIAFLAGLVVFPLIFAFGLSEAVGGSTLGALFITLPHAFAEMGAAGRVVGFLFFAALLMGALTSAISILEVVTATVIDGLGWTRARAAVATGVAVTLVGIPSALDSDVLGVVDATAGNLFLLLGGLGLAVFVGWRMPDPIGAVRTGAEGVRWFFLWRTLLRFVVPVVLGVVLLTTIPVAWEALRNLGG